jgi:serine/threonine-protein kinase
MEALAAGLGGLIAAIVGLLTPFFWNSALAVQKGSAEMTRLVTGFHGYMGRMRLLGLGFADLCARDRADAQFLTTVSDAAGDAMLDSAGILSGVGAWPAGRGTVKVPDVAAKSWADAATLAADRGLAVTLKELAYSDIESGKVSAQSPAANTLVETGTTIELTLSKGKEPQGEVKAVETPPLAGKSWADAEEAARGKGLAVTYAGSRRDAAAKDTVIEQQPPAGTQVVAGSTVKLTLSDGPQAAAGQEVPDLDRMTADQAQDALAAAKLKCKFGDFAYAADDKGLVVSQNIPAKTLVADGTTVSVTVSMGKQP